MPRIIAGEFRGRRLGGAAESTRPTSDRVREAIASMLGARMDLAGTRVLDLYAGTGALALEALSRGAATAVLVDADRRACAVARENIAVCGAQTRARVVQRSVTAFLDAPGPQYDLVFLDPPYAMPAAEVGEALTALVPHLADGAWVVLERAARGDAPVWPAGLAPVTDKTYGDTAITLAAVPRAGDDR